MESPLILSTQVSCSWQLWPQLQRFFSPALSAGQHGHGRCASTLGCYQVGERSVAGSSVLWKQDRCHIRWPVEPKPPTSNATLFLEKNVCSGKKGWVKLNLYFLTFRSNTFSTLCIIHKHMHTQTYAYTFIWKYRDKIPPVFFSFPQIPASIFQSAKFLWPGTRVSYQCSPALMQQL